MNKHKAFLLLKSKYGKVINYCEDIGITKQYLYQLFDTPIESKRNNPTWAKIVEDLCECAKDMEEGLKEFKNNLEEKDEVFGETKEL